MDELMNVLLKVAEQSPALLIAVLWIRSLEKIIAREVSDHRDTRHYYRECNNALKDALDRHIDQEQRG